MSMDTFNLDQDQRLTPAGVLMGELMLLIEEQGGFSEIRRKSIQHHHERFGSGSADATIKDTQAESGAADNA